MTRRAIRLMLVLAMAGTIAACGVFSDDEEPLEGKRIPVRDLLNQNNAMPAAQVATPPQGTTKRQ